MMNKIDARYLRLGRALFGSYNVHSGGLAWNKEPVPTWSEIVTRETTVAASGQKRLAMQIKPDGVIGHWRHVAIDVATSPEHAEAIARAIETRYEGNEVYQRVTG